MHVIIVYGNGFENIAEELASYAKSRGVKAVLIKNPRMESLRLIASPFSAEDPSHAKAIIDLFAANNGSLKE